MDRVANFVQFAIDKYCMNKIALIKYVELLYLSRLIRTIDGNGEYEINLRNNPYGYREPLMPIHSPFV